jgi:hypothetical protein
MTSVRRRKCPPNQALLFGLHRGAACELLQVVAARPDLDDAVGHTQNPGLRHLRSERGGSRNHSGEKSLAGTLDFTSARSSS